MFKKKVSSYSKYLTFISLGGLLWGGISICIIKPVLATASLQCEIIDVKDGKLTNQAKYTYLNDFNNINEYITNKVLVAVTNNTAQTDLLPGGIKDQAGNQVFSLGSFFDAWQAELKSIGFSDEEATKAGEAVLAQFIGVVRSNFTTEEAIASLKKAMIVAVPDQETAINSLTNDRLLVISTGLARQTLAAMGLSAADLTLATETAKNGSGAIALDTNFKETRTNLYTNTQNVLSEEGKGKMAIASDLLTAEINRAVKGDTPAVGTGETLDYQFNLENLGPGITKITIPDAATLQKEGLTGPGKIVGVTYQVINSEGTVVRTGNTTTTAETIVINPSEQIKLSANTTLGEINPISVTSVTMGLTVDCGEKGNITTSQQSLSFVYVLDPLTDPFGQITGCAGELLPDYSGFSVAFYDPKTNDATASTLGQLTELTLTEVPDNPNNRIPVGIAPNITNANPFFLTNNDEGRYSFLFDEGRGQLDKGRTYILAINPPNSSTYNERYIKIVIGDTNDNVVEYTAISLDGQPITVADPLGRTEIQGEIVIVEDAERIGLDIGVIEIGASICNPQLIRIDKTGDRSTAEPGDTVIYRIAVRNLSPVALRNIVINDILPAGFNFIPIGDEKVKAEIDKQPVNLDVNQNGKNLTFTLDGTLATGKVLNIIYAAQVTPDAVRGNGRNTAAVEGKRVDLGDGVPPLRDGPVFHKLTIRPGILSDTGIILGQVFVDKNFDGMPQNDEPGVPNAVIYFQDGNRVTTDEEGKFSLKNVLPGAVTGVLDLSSLPGYGLAPNLYFKEKNSQSRLIRLAPGGMGVMNFGVTPAFGEEEVEP